MERPAPFRSVVELRERSDRRLAACDRKDRVVSVDEAVGRERSEAGLDPVQHGPPLLGRRRFQALAAGSESGTQRQERFPRVGEIQRSLLRSHDGKPHAFINFPSVSGQLLQPRRLNTF